MRSGRPPALYTCIKCIYMCTRQFQPPGWGHHPASRVAPPSTLDVYMYIGPHFWQVDGPEVLLIDPGLTFCTWTASRPHLAMIFYPPFSTTHFYLLITWLIHSHIPEWLIPNLDKTQNVILDSKKKVNALLKFRVLETRKLCRIFFKRRKYYTYKIWGLFLQMQFPKRMSNEFSGDLYKHDIWSSGLLSYL